MTSCRHTGKTIEIIERDTNRDFYLAKAAVDYGLVDHVMEIPNMKLLAPAKRSSEALIPPFEPEGGILSIG